MERDEMNILHFFFFLNAAEGLGHSYHFFSENAN